jgi:hypothetical protein
MGNNLLLLASWFILAVLCVVLFIQKIKIDSLKAGIRLKYTDSEMRGIIYKEQCEQKRTFEEEALSKFVGQPVLVVSNNWEDPVIGIMKSIAFITQAQSPVPVVYDYVSSKELICLGHIQACTFEKLDIFISMTPSQRWHMLAQRDTYEMMLPEPSWANLLSSDEIHKRLDAGNFKKLLTV